MIQNDIDDNKSSNRFSVLKFISLTIVSCIPVGIAFGIVGSFFYLVIAFPIIMGVLGGIIIIKNKQFARINNMSALQKLIFNIRNLVDLRVFRSKNHE